MLHAPADAEERARTAGGAERRGQAYRNPALTAKIAATLQVLTHGRFILGLGAGDAEAEHRAYGFPFPGASRRVEQLDEAAAIVRLLWTRDAATFQGKHYRVEQAVCLPRPAPPPALMIGGAGERRTLRVVARHAEWVELRLLQSRRVRAEARRATRTLPCDRARPRRARTHLLHGGHRRVRPPAARAPPVHGPSRGGRVVSGTPDEVTRQLGGIQRGGRQAYATQLPGLPAHGQLRPVRGQGAPALWHRGHMSRP
ncbi:MAG: LLM class flavin-dependent oxidoreductase [Chloroflexi bacterium]|nr:LLM class flavin-dependent oxidoreductase [Chloroflexota bacterium]